jgi:hypothetical protein
VQWLIPVIPATWEAQMEGSQFEVSQGKKLAKSYIKKQSGHGNTHLETQLQRKKEARRLSSLAKVQNPI